MTWLVILSSIWFCWSSRLYITRIVLTNDMSPQSFRTSYHDLFIPLCWEDKYVGCEKAAMITYRHQGSFWPLSSNGALKSPNLMHLKDIHVFVVECGLQQLDLHWRFDWYQDVLGLGLYITFLPLLYVHLETMDCISHFSRNKRTYRGLFTKVFSCLRLIEAIHINTPAEIFVMIALIEESLFMLPDDDWNLKWFSLPNHKPCFLLSCTFQVLALFWSSLSLRNLESLFYCLVKNSPVLIVSFSILEVNTGQRPLLADEGGTLTLCL